MNNFSKVITLVALSSTALVGCGQVDRGVAAVKGHSNHCIDGVAYIQFRNGATVKYNEDGTVATCN